MELTKNFRLEEFLHSDTAVAKNIDNTPSEEELENVKYMAEQLQLIRNAYKQAMYITSGYRCEELNAAVGGSKKSYHKKGLAVDIQQGGKIRNKNLFALVRKMMKFGLPVDELIDEYNFSWVHISFTPKGQIPKLQIKHIK